MNVPASPWYLKKATVLVALAVVGLLGLPFLWKSPEFPRKTKVVLTAITLVLAAVFMAVTPTVVRLLERQMAALNAL